MVILPQLFCPPARKNRCTLFFFGVADARRCAAQLSECLHARSIMFFYAEPLLVPAQISVRVQLYVKRVQVQMSHNMYSL